MIVAGELFRPTVRRILRFGTNAPTDLLQIEEIEDSVARFPIPSIGRESIIQAECAQRRIGDTTSRHAAFLQR